MTLNEFVAIWNGRYCEVAGSANAQNQCVDICNAYIRDVLGLPIIEWTNAIDFPSKAGSKYDYIKNTPTGVPLEGDLVIWGNSPGHIAIFIEGNSSSFKSFDQNYPLGSPCHIQGHTYANVLGWLHPKGGIPMDNQIITQSDNWIALITTCNLPNSKDGAIAEVNRRTELADKVEEKDREIEQKNIQLAQIETKLDELELENAKHIGDIEELGERLKENNIKFSALQDEINELKKIKPITDYSARELLGKLLEKLF